MNDDRLESLKLLIELRSNYNCFDAKEEPYYRALSIAIASIQNVDWLEAKTILIRKAYEHEYSLRKEFEVKIAKLEKAIETLEKEPLKDCEDCLTFKTIPNSCPLNAIEIVTCKDCKYRDPEDKFCDCGHTIKWSSPREDNFYCADAERKI